MNQNTFYKDIDESQIPVAAVAMVQVLVEKHNLPRKPKVGFFRKCGILEADWGWHRPILGACDGLRGEEILLSADLSIEELGRICNHELSHSAFLQARPEAPLTDAEKQASEKQAMSDENLFPGLISRFALSEKSTSTIFGGRD